MRRVLASLAVVALLASPVLAQTGTTTNDPYNNTTGTTTTTDPNTGTTTQTTTTTDPNTGTTTPTNEVDRTTGTPGERGVGTGSGEPMQYGNQANNTGTADNGTTSNGALPATASPLPLLGLIGAGSLVLGLMATRRSRNTR